MKKARVIVVGFLWICMSSGTTYGAPPEETNSWAPIVKGEHAPLYEKLLNPETPQGLELIAMNNFLRENGFRLLAVRHVMPKPTFDPSYPSHLPPAPRPGQLLILVRGAPLNKNRSDVKWTATLTVAYEYSPGSPTVEDGEGTHQVTSVTLDNIYGRAGSRILCVATPVGGGPEYYGEHYLYHLAMLNALQRCQDAGHGQCMVHCR